MYPKITVVIPFYNCPYVDRAITSVLNQTYPNIEIIVVDDGSTMYTGLIKPFLSDVYYLGKANGGTASAVNHGIRKSSGDYIAWLSSDDKFKPDKIMRQWTFMQKNQSSFCFSAYATMDKGDCIMEDFVEPDIFGPNDIYRLLSNYNPINGCTTLVSKELFGWVGLFNESLPYTHDYDMWVRLALQGVRLDYLPEALTIYRFHDQMGSVRHRPELIAEFLRVQKKYREPMKRLLQTMA
jgi:teichuronic acid biosynthesis glycosyltransferase TuaG